MLPKALGKFKPRTSESRRIPLEREISFRVPRFENFVTEYSANISATGIFIRTRDPLEPGTELNLEFKVADDWQLIRGRGRVIWVRSEGEGPQAPAGMGIRFLEMDPQSRRLIHWMVEKHAREGGETFEFEALRQTADQALGEALTDKQEAVIIAGGGGRSIAADRSSLTRRPFLVLAAVGLLAVLAWLFLRLTPPETAGQPAAAAPQAAAQLTPRVAGDGGTESGLAGAPPTSTAVGSPDSAASQLVRDWAAAWSAGRVQDYLSFYSDDFRPDGGLSLRQWRATRAERLSAPQYIRVAITALELEVLGAGRMRATFFQNYRSDRFEDTVRKSLLLGLEDGGWRILEERVVG